MKSAYLWIFIVLIASCSGKNSSNKKESIIENSPMKTAQLSSDKKTTDTSTNNTDPDSGEPFRDVASGIPQNNDCSTSSINASDTNCNNTISVSAYHNLHINRFSKCLLEQTDANMSAKDIKGIYCHQDKALQAVKDLHYFPALETLEITGTGLTVIDLSHNPNLKRLELQGNNLQNLDLNQNLALEYLDLRNNDELKTIDLTKLSNLKHIDLPDHLKGKGDNILRITGKVSGLKSSNSEVKVNFSGDIWTLKNSSNFDVRLSSGALADIRFIKQPAGETCQFEKVFAQSTESEMENNIICNQ